MAGESVDTGAADGASALTEEQRISNVVNAAVSSQLKRALPKVLGEALEAHLAPFREATAARQQHVAPAGDGTPEPEWKGRMETLERNLKEERSARAAEKRASLERGAYEALRTELTGKVRPEAVDAAAKLLFHADKSVKVTSDGAVSFVLGDDEYDLKEGVAAYLKTPAAALFVAAPGYNDKRKQASGKVPQRVVAGRTPQQGNVREDPLEKTMRDLGLPD